MIDFRGAIASLACGSMAALAGCGDAEHVTRYTVERPAPMAEVAKGSDPHAGLNLPSRPTGEPKDRTLGAIVTHGPQGWFFKLTGDKDAVAGKSDDFTALLKTVRFGDDGKPQWTLPAGWQHRAGNDIRYATLVIPDDERPLEVSVTALPFSGDATAYALSNVNRWRNQLQLPPITADQLAQESKQVALAEGAATVVDLVGTASGAPMGGPFMSGARDGN